MRSSGSVTFELAHTLSESGMTYTITRPDGSTYTIQQGFRMSLPVRGGDSGGPVVLESIYGPLAVGSTIAENGFDSFGQYFAAYLYSYGVQMNATTSSTRCTNS